MLVGDVALKINPICSGCRVFYCRKKAMFSNDVTGDKIVNTKGNHRTYAENFDLIFRKEEGPAMSSLDHPCLKNNQSQSILVGAGKDLELGEKKASRTS